MKTTLLTSTFAPEGSYEHWQSRLIASVGDISTLGQRKWAEVASYEIFPGVRLDSEAFTAPEEWLPPGHTRRPSFRRIEFNFLTTCRSNLRDTLLESLKRSVFALSLPHRNARSISRLKPVSWLFYSHLTIRLAKFVVEDIPSTDGSLWSHLNGADWNRAIEAVSPTKRKREELAVLVKKLSTIGSRGILNDYPILEKQSSDAMSSDTIESSRRHSENNSTVVTADLGAVEPFSDDFVGQFIGRCTWLSENLSEQFLDFYIEYLAVEKTYLARGLPAKHFSTIGAKKNLLKSFEWRTKDGNPLTELPWPIKMNIGRRKIFTRQWPPDNNGSVETFLSIIQAVNFSLIAFCTAARPGEILSATLDSLPDARDGVFSAKSFKTTEYNSGYSREWPLHEAAAKALRIQFRLARILKEAEKTHIWVTIRNTRNSKRGAASRGISPLINSAVDTLGLKDLTGNRGPHAHRWRHTVARLVALSVASAPQILMDLLGHREIESTLHYMLSSSNISQDVIKIADELSAVHAKQAIADTQLGQAGGRAAVMLKTGLDNFTMSRGDAALDADSLQDAIDILTFNGRFWQMVRPGVICTKTIGQFGPCTKGRGAPDPGACRSTCDHRLETSRAKQQCHDTIEALLREHAHAVREGLDMLVANLEGQILANLHRWDSVRDHFLRESNVAQSVWAARTPNTVAA